MKTHKCLGCGVKLRRRTYCRSCARRHNPHRKTRVIIRKIERDRRR